MVFGEILMHMQVRGVQWGNDQTFLFTFVLLFLLNWWLFKNKTILTIMINEILVDKTKKKGHG